MTLVNLAIHRITSLTDPPKSFIQILKTLLSVMLFSTLSMQTLFEMNLAQKSSSSLSRLSTLKYFNSMGGMESSLNSSKALRSCENTNINRLSPFLNGLKLLFFNCLFSRSIPCFISSSSNSSYPNKQKKRSVLSEQKKKNLLHPLVHFLNQFPYQRRIRRYSTKVYWPTFSWTFSYRCISS